MQTTLLLTLGFLATPSAQATSSDNARYVGVWSALSDAKTQSDAHDILRYHFHDQATVTRFLNWLKQNPDRLTSIESEPARYLLRVSDPSAVVVSQFALKSNLYDFEERQRWTALVQDVALVHSADSLDAKSHLEKSPLIRFGYGLTALTSGALWLGSIKGISPAGILLSAIAIGAAQHKLLDWGRALKKEKRIRPVLFKISDQLRQFNNSDLTQAGVNQIGRTMEDLMARTQDLVDGEIEQTHYPKDSERIKIGFHSALPLMHIFDSYLDIVKSIPALTHTDLKWEPLVAHWSSVRHRVNGILSRAIAGQSRYRYEIERAVHLNSQFDETEAKFDRLKSENRREDKSPRDENGEALAEWQVEFHDDHWRGGSGTGLLDPEWENEGDSENQARSMSLGRWSKLTDIKLHTDDTDLVFLLPDKLAKAIGYSTRGPDLVRAVEKRLPPGVWIARPRESDKIFRFYPLDKIPHMHSTAEGSLELWRRPWGPKSALIAQVTGNRALSPEEVRAMYHAHSEGRKVPYLGVTSKSALATRARTFMRCALSALLPGSR